MGRIFFALIGGLLTLNSFVLEWIFPGERQFAASLCALFGAFILAFPIIVTAVKDLINGKVYMNELVALAILAALASADFQTAGIIAFFLLITIIIETRTASGAQRSIEELIKLTPNTAHKVGADGNSESDVQVTDLAIGDRIRVRPGENFPVDARIVSGESTVNQASITGESLPVEKGAGDDVFAGTQNLTGLVELEVTKVGEDTTLGKVKDMIMQAEASRTPVVRIIDRYAGYYTPTVLMLACITWWFTEDISRVITLMVIACPCAVVLATPTAVVAAVAAAEMEIVGHHLGRERAVGGDEPVGEVHPHHLLAVGQMLELLVDDVVALSQRIVGGAPAREDRQKQRHGLGLLGGDALKNRADADNRIGRRLVRLGEVAGIVRSDHQHHHSRLVAVKLAVVDAPEHMLGAVGSVAQVERLVRPLGEVALPFGSGFRPFPAVGYRVADEDDLADFGGGNVLELLLMALHPPSPSRAGARLGNERADFAVGRMDGTCRQQKKQNRLLHRHSPL